MAVEKSTTSDEKIANDLSISNVDYYNLFIY